MLVLDIRVFLLGNFKIYNSSKEHFNIHVMLDLTEKWELKVTDIGSRFTGLLYQKADYSRLT